MFLQPFLVFLVNDNKSSPYLASGRVWANEWLAFKALLFPANGWVAPPPHTTIYVLTTCSLMSTGWNEIQWLQEANHLGTSLGGSVGNVLVFEWLPVRSWPRSTDFFWGEVVTLYLRQVTYSIVGTFVAHSLGERAIIPCLLTQSSGNYPSCTIPYPNTFSSYFLGCDVNFVNTSTYKIIIASERLTHKKVALKAQFDWLFVIT